MKSRILTLTIIVGLVSALTMYGQTSKSEYRIAKTISLTGEGGWDYLSVDQINNRLFVSHGTQVNIADLGKGTEIAVVPGTPGVHGIAIANDINKAFITCGRDTTVKVIDLTTFKEIARIKVTGQNPDAILYDQFSHKVFTFNGRSANSTVIDARENKVIGTIQLTGKPEFPQTDGAGKIYVNIEDKSNVTMINANTLVAEKVWPIAPGEEPTGLALDKTNNRLFSVCGNKLMVVLDALSGKVITTLPIGDGCDGIAFDPGTKRIFASNGEGNMTVVQQDGPDKYRVIETFPTIAGARTITVDKTTHHIYLSVAERAEGNSRSMKPNSFRVIDIEPVSNK